MSDLESRRALVRGEVHTPDGPIPLRWDPSCIAYSGREHARKVCRICGQAFAVMPPSRARYYQTCSDVCNRALRSLVRKGKPWSERARAADRRQKRFR